MKDWLKIRKQAMGNRELSFFKYLDDFCSQVIEALSNNAISLLELDLNNARNHQDLAKLQQEKLPNFRSQEYGDVSASVRDSSRLT